MQIYSECADQGKWKELSERTGLEPTAERTADGEPYLCIDRDGAISLVSGAQSLRGDFARMMRRVEPANLNGELVVRAARIRGLSMPLRVADATAGLGEDSFLLAAAGYEVQMYEYDPVIAVLLQDALDRARASDDPALAGIARRMHFQQGDSRELLRQMKWKPDIVLLDPMFPARRKSGLVRKKLQFIQQLEKPCDDEHSLMDAAIAADPRKIIVKRPKNAAYLAGRKPSSQVKGKIIRYDCIVLPGMQRPEEAGDHNGEVVSASGRA